MLLDLLYSEDIDIKDLEKYFLASSVPIKNFVTGIIATRRTTNGVLLTILIITLMIL